MWSQDKSYTAEKIRLSKLRMLRVVTNQVIKSIDDSV
jgi:hypothetical protein